MNLSACREVARVDSPTIHSRAYRFTSLCQGTDVELHGGAPASTVDAHGSCRSMPKADFERSVQAAPAQCEGNARGQIWSEAVELTPGTEGAVLRFGTGGRRFPDAACNAPRHAVCGERRQGNRNSLGLGAVRKIGGVLLQKSNAVADFEKLRGNQNARQPSFVRPYTGAIRP